ncbi:coproporphyrinogen dehydrogenase HemZ [Clostridium sp. 'deep sea']|uniref:coproporphyrinogen dehydrogenase HemZ n=1 Tax=Clostridium sp. 'deep sea' TaxID=2779445 RepID=UPI0018965EE3|nr:coproporphyrinogen dehydrogenase HemZ [Clostridium sp. 'deep sea']QOR35690.1 coproporphyrinogen dehydrogenase HemZ [Clostridium sp. 'deep sea']
MSKEWGKLRGVRPVKLVNYYKIQNSDETIKDILIEKHGLFSSTADLLISVANTEQKVTANILKNVNNVALYINIPFCPSRCTYCSFITIENSKSKDLQKQYLECLLLELDQVLTYLKDSGKIIAIVYIGGGTPTVFDYNSLQSILSLLNKYELSKVVEFTVEAGRADTVTNEKFQLLKQYGVSRVSINPQTMNIKTLKKVNRNHTIEQVYNAVEIAKSYDFILNMDMILGLPAENIADVVDTLTKIKAFKPHNITVHNLARKRSSFMTVKNNFAELNEQLLLEMNQITTKNLTDFYIPYYLYRQKNTVGGHANIGYSIKGYECIYNMVMISELCSIYACGAGAVTKVLDKDKKFTRLSTPKNAVNYINNINSIIDKKIRWFKNYECK